MQKAEMVPRRSYPQSALLSLGAGLKVVALVVGIGIPAVVAHTLSEQYDSAVENAESLAISTARTLEQHAARNIESIDAHLRALVSVIGPGARDIEPHVLQAALHDQLSRSKYLNNLMIVDRDSTLR